MRAACGETTSAHTHAHLMAESTSAAAMSGSSFAPALPALPLLQARGMLLPKSGTAEGT